MMKTIAFYNLKGGVGKTATAVNIAWIAARSGLKTVFWDLDQQGASSFYLRVDPKLSVKTKKLITGKKSLGKQAQPTEYDNLSLIPADESYRDMDLMISDRKNSAEVLAEVLEPLNKSYDLLVLDCPPSFSTLSENIFATTDAILLPLIPTPLSIRAYDQIVAFFKKHKIPRRKLHPFFSMVDRRRKLHKQWLENPPRELINLLSAYIPYASVVEQMGQHQAPVGAYSPHSPVQAAYVALWEELAMRLKLTAG